MTGRRTIFSRFACCGAIPACIVLTAVGAAWPAAAQQTQTIFDPELLSPSRFGRGFRMSQLNPRPKAETEAIEAWGWLLSPYVSAGAFYDTNPSNSSHNPKGQWGLRLQPGFSARRDTGIHNTRIYGAADLRLYDDGNYNQVTGYLGFTHRYEIMRDLVWRFQGEYGQFATRGYGASRRSDANYFRDGYFSTSLIKGFDRFTIGGGAAFENTDPLSSIQKGGSTATFSLQSGYQLLPRLNGYVAGEYDRVFNTSRDSSGYNATAGATYVITDLWTLNGDGGFATPGNSGTTPGGGITPIFGASAPLRGTPAASINAKTRARVGVDRGPEVTEG
ncbi:outer membrane beta-barrel protein, partial [Nostoc sp. NIES-2111]